MILVKCRIVNFTISIDKNTSKKEKKAKRNKDEIELNDKKDFMNGCGIYAASEFFS